jgi:hypothetical protein
MKMKLPSTPSPSRGPQSLMTFNNLCLIKVKPCKIDVLLKSSTAKVFLASQLLYSMHEVSKICKYIF